MSNVRPTFAKRNRETSLKDKARIKDERRAAKRQEVRTVKGPEIAWDEAVREIDSDPTLGPATNEHSSAPAPKPTAAAPSKPMAAAPSKPMAAAPSKPMAAAPSKPTAAPAPMATSSSSGAAKPSAPARRR
jgi:hypothetical protein